MRVMPSFLLACGLVLTMSASWAQADSPAPVAGTLVQVVHLSASAQTEVPQDWLVLSLSVQKEGPQAATVQQQLNATLSAAVATAQPWVKPGQVALSTGGMQVSPRYGREGKILGWQGSAQLILQGRDAPTLTAVAGRLTDMSVSSIEWTLSDAQRQEAEMRIQAQAVDSFKHKAEALTRQFGLSRYVLREVRVSSPEAGIGFQPRLAIAPMDAAVAPPAPVPTVAGKTKVVVNLSGSIQLQ